MDLKALAANLKDPKCDEAHPSKLKVIFTDIAEVLKAGSQAIPNIIVKETVFAMGTLLGVIASHIC